MCAGKNCIYVAGGRQRENGVCRLNLDTFEWVDLPEMTTGRRNPGKLKPCGRKCCVFACKTSDFKQITTEDATTATVTKEDWREYACERSSNSKMRSSMQNVSDR